MRFKNLKAFLSYREECPLCKLPLKPVCTIEGNERFPTILDGYNLKIQCNVFLGEYVEGIDVSINILDNSVAFTELRDDGFNFELIVSCPCSKYHYTSNLLMFKEQKELTGIRLFYESFYFDNFTISTFHDDPKTTSVKTDKGVYVALPFYSLNKLMGLSEQEIQERVKRLLLLA